MFIKAQWFEDLKGANILAVNPPVYDFAWFDLWAKPAGLLRFLGYLKTRGNNITLIDCLHEGREKPLSYGRWKTRREERDKPRPLKHIPRRYYRFGLSENDFKNRLREAPSPEVILVTSIMTYWYPGVAESIRILREFFPARPIILGGIYATLCPEHAAALGADQVMPTYCSPQGRHIPLDLYREPGYALLSTTFGCPRRCYYCASSVLNPRFQPRPLTEIIKDLENQATIDTVRDLAFYDDALLWNREELFYPLCRYISENFPDLGLHSPNGLSVDGLDQSCCRALKKAGFKTLRLSFEGLDSRTREASDNKVNAAAYLKAVENLLAAGYKSWDIETYLLLGLPGQRLEDIEASIEYVQRAGSRPKLCEYSPIPGTRLFQAEAEVNPQIAEEPLWHNNSVYTAYLSGRMDANELQRLKNSSRPK